LSVKDPWVPLCLEHIPSWDAGVGKINTRYSLTHSIVDKRNIELIQRHLDDLLRYRSEEEALLRINNPFEKLLRRSLRQLLFFYRKSELTQLHKDELNLLRNAIYARHGYTFGTAKLQKYFNRQLWYKPDEQYTPYSLSAVDVCNAFFLDDYYSTRELGARGR